MNYSLIFVFTSNDNDEQYLIMYINNKNKLTNN
jgi:hypothetical protein